MDSNRTGWISELVFTLYAAKSDWGIATPAGGNYGYDLVIKRADKWETVQVKTIYACNRRPGDAGLQATITRNRQGKKKHYVAESFDLLAGVYKETIWLIPIKKIELNKTAVCFSDPKWTHYILPPPKPLEATKKKDQTPPGPQKEMF